MGYTYNPLIFSGLDLSGSSGSVGAGSWKDSVATESALPAIGSDGDARVAKDTDKIYVWDDTSSQWIDTGITSATFGSTPNSSGFTLSTSDVGNIRYRTLILQPADATNPGGVSTATQSFAGIKTFGSQINADGGIDRSTSGTLTIGGTNSSIINIGNSGATVNIIGTVLSEQVTNLTVTDKLITINKGGGVGSGAATGLEIEENSSITGYFKTSSDRNSWQLVAPNTAGVATITPGAGGITLDQSSHNPLTLGAVGSSPNANAASLSTQVLTLQPADGSNPGVITAGTQTIGGAKTFSSTIAASNFSGTSSGTNTGDQTITLTSDVTGSGTGSFATTVAKIQGTTVSGTTGTGNVVFSASPTITGTITGTTSGNLLKSTGDIDLTSFSAANNQSSATNVTGLAFANGSVRAFRALVSVFVSATSSLYEVFELLAVQKGASWDMSVESAGDASGFTFTITTAGQVQYTNSNYSGFSSAAVRFRAMVTSV